MQIRFASADIYIIVHATEDHLKILDIIEQMLKISRYSFISNRLEGHYGNDIILMKAKLNTKDATDLAQCIIDALSIEEKNHLVNNLSNYINRNSLYIRISKQDLFKNKIRLGDGIKIRFKVKGFKPEVEFDNLRKMMSEDG